MSKYVSRMGACNKLVVNKLVLETFANRVSSFLIGYPSILTLCQTKLATKWQLEYML